MKIGVWALKILKMDKEKLKAIQEEMVKKVVIPDGNKGFQPRKGGLLFTLDIQYENDIAFAAVDILRWGKELLGVAVKKYEAKVPYVPGYFAFREGPILIQIIQDIRKKMGLMPDLVIVDGHGTAHPRQFGLACWIGVKLKVPTIGVGKETLVQFEEQAGKKAGAKAPIHLKENLVGYVLRTQENIKPVFVSAGHLISQENAVKVVMSLRGIYRQIEPVRRADQTARAFARGEKTKNMIDLGV